MKEGVRVSEIGYQGVRRGESVCQGVLGRGSSTFRQPQGQYEHLKPSSVQSLYHTAHQQSHLTREGVRGGERRGGEGGGVRGGR